MAYTYQVESSASLDRLEKLIAERLVPGADKKLIDTRIWDLFGETWAVMFTDLSGFSRHVKQFGIIHFLQIIYESKRILVPAIDRFDGILLKMEGDSMLVIFRSVMKALECAVAMNRALIPYNRHKEEAEKILLCIGLGYGTMLRIGDTDVFGSQVNAASKLGEDRAKGGEILVTGEVVDALKKSKITFKPLARPTAGADRSYKLIYNTAGKR